MAEPGDETKTGYQTGESFSPKDLHVQFGIPLEEVNIYRDCMRIYPKGAVIIKEAAQEQALYLLRVGTVEVSKGSRESHDLMGEIEAVNIFGEMSMINNEPRSATVTAATDNVLVYRIATPNIHTILTNPMWAELLISRLCQNLARSIEQQAAASKQVKALCAEVESLKPRK